MFCQKCGTQNPENGKFCRACGTDLGNTSIAAGGFFQPMQPIQPIQPRDLSAPSADYYIDRKGKVRSNNPDELYSSGIRNIILGVGFLIVAVALFSSGGARWWWAMLFPAFSLLSSGMGSYTKSKRLEKKKLQAAETQTQSPPTFAAPQSNAGLPPSQTDYVNPQKSIYDTGEFAVPPSVTENTTKHLEINREGETMTLPKDGK